MKEDSSKAKIVQSTVHENIYEELMKIAESDPILMQAFNAWEDLSMSEEHIEAYDKRLNQLSKEEKLNNSER